MIALVRGELALRGADHVVIDCGGVGYKLAISAQTRHQLPAADGKVVLHTHLIAGDDALTLFGFHSEAERDLFLLLISVQQVGPKVALAILSAGTPAELAGAIAAGDAARFQTVKGIGRRTAERIIVELRERVDLGDPAGPIAAHRAEDPHALARAGLLELGYASAEASRLLEGSSATTVEALISDALRAARR